MGSTVVESHSQQHVDSVEASESVRPPFFITKGEERTLRINAGRSSPSLVITQATSFDEYTRQLMVPPTVMDLARKASDIRLSTWEIEGIRAQLEPSGGGLLRRILREKIESDDSHPPYIRVACTEKVTMTTWPRNMDTWPPVVMVTRARQ